MTEQLWTVRSLGAIWLEEYLALPITIEKVTFHDRHYNRAMTRWAVILPEGYEDDPWTQRLASSGWKTRKAAMEGWQREAVALAEAIESFPNIETLYSVGPSAFLTMVLEKHDPQRRIARYDDAIDANGKWR